jgi:hypothetical protein
MEPERVHNSPSLAPFLSQMHPVHTFAPYFLQNHFNIILLAACSVHLILLELLILIIFGEAYKL